MLTTSEATDSAMLVGEIRMPLGGRGPPLMHRHAPSEIYHPPAMSTVLELAQRCGIEMLGPVPQSALR